MKNMIFNKKNIVILGMGITGISCLNFFLKKGIIPKIMDSSISPKLLKLIPNNIPYCLGYFNRQWISDSDLIIISPGIPLSKIYNISKNVNIISDIELFINEIDVPIISITGSNGKSTVTKLVGDILNEANFRVSIGGNNGIPVLTILDKTKQLYVLEISSFQLESTHNLVSKISTVLNISQDHMDRYSTIEKYRISKLRIYNNSSSILFNADDPLTLPLNKLKSNYISFGYENGDYFLYKENNNTWLVANNELLFNCKELSIIGDHNYTNALAALAIADNLNIPRNITYNALKKFKGLPHRFELVYENKGVKWINDSKATNIDSTKMAIKNINILGVLHLILGGDSKSANFFPLLPYLFKEKIKVYCFGKDAYKIASLIPKISIVASTLTQVMYIISNKVKSGDLVLLSPSCSSLDQFENFQERGRLFTSLAKKLG